MGVPGQVPKDDADRIRRNPPPFEKVPLEWDGKVRGPDLPKRYKQLESGKWKIVRWHPATVQWYEQWRRTPQSMVFIETDWGFFVRTAILIDRFYTEDLETAKMISLFAEIRRCEEAYGGTFESRRKLRMEIKTPANEQHEEDQIRTEAQRAVNYIEKLTREASRQRK